MGNPYTLPRGTTWPLLITIIQGGVPVNLQSPYTWRLLATVRPMLVDGTVDSVSPYIWQGDTLGTGINVLVQSGSTLGQAQVVMPAAYTQALPNPISGSVQLWYDIVANDGQSDEFQVEAGIIRLTPRVTLSQP